jgi:hypothetical protein
MRKLTDPAYILSSYPGSRASHAPVRLFPCYSTAERTAGSSVTFDYGCPTPLNVLIRELALGQPTVRAIASTAIRGDPVRTQRSAENSSTSMAASLGMA